MFYKYKVEFVDEEYETKNAEGLVHAVAYGDAAEKVVEDYGRDQVVSIYLSELYTECQCLTKEEIEDTFKD